MSESWASLVPCPTRRVVCVAPGPSLTHADVRYVRGKATVLVVNDAHRMAPWADVLYSSDRHWWIHYKAIPWFSGVRVGLCTSREPGALRFNSLFKDWPPMVFVRNTGPVGLESAPDGVRACGSNSGGAAVNLAVHLGAKDIYLIGYDVGLGANGARHFFGDHPPGLSNGQNFKVWRVAFRLMVEPLQALGVRVWNCSRSTSLKCFPRVKVEDVL